MTTDLEVSTARREDVDELASLLRRGHERVAVAESLTGGLLTSCLAAGTGASEWLRGGIVAYSPEVKRGLLGVRPGPVVSGETASDMARGVARLLEAELAIAVTGVGGPDAQEGNEPGTVWVAVAHHGEIRTRRLQLGGGVEEVCAETCRQAVRYALEAIAGESSPVPFPDR